MHIIQFCRTHLDLDLALLIVVAGIFDSLILGYTAPNLGGSIPGAIFLGVVLAILMTSPFFLYLAGKYIRRGYQTRIHHA